MQSIIEPEFRPLGKPLFDQVGRRMGVAELHDFQKQAISAVIKGQDSFLVVPTGGGKSLCYIAPALFLSGLVLVVSPLIALMRDQQRQLDELNVPGLSLDSLMSPDEKRQARAKILSGAIKVLYVSPERLALPGFRELLRDIKIALVAVDEAHCVHEWGQGFRADYLRLGSYLDELGPAPRMALTATVTQVERSAIIASLRLKEPRIILKNQVRENLDLVIHRHNKVDLQKHHLISSLAGSQDQGIVYAATRKNVEEMFHLLRARKFPVSFYHGGMHADERQRSQSDFVEGRSQIMVATKAFGMGINLPSVRFISHANMPCSIESYAQEVGRAGRDGLYSRCDLHYGPRDYFLQKYIIEKSYPSEADFLKVAQALRLILSDTSRVRVENLPVLLTIKSGIGIELVQGTLDFLLREQAIKSIETISDDYCLEGFLSVGVKGLDLDSLLQALREQVAWKFDKLNAMHQLVKGIISPRHSIEAYFN